jgi:predicted Zn-dependent peptidase
LRFACRFPVLAIVLLLAAPAAALTLAVEQHELRNGMRVLLHEDHSAPTVSSYVFYHVGSSAERYGGTGLAHLFEHMMFNGSRKFGKGAFDDVIEGSGGSTNGYTTRDFTAYLNDFPPEALPVVLDLESDRMHALLITAQNLEQERGIVMEERRLRVDNAVGGAMYEALYLHAFVASPYRWHPVGFMSDLEHITLESATAFFRSHYVPSNATLVLAGDFAAADALAQARRYFEGIPRGNPPPPPVVSEPPQTGERHVIVRKPAELPALLLGYRGVSVEHPDRAALDVAAKVLAGGRSARLTERLVRDEEVATGVDADLTWSKYEDLFVIETQARPGRQAAEVLRSLTRTLRTLAEEPIAERELARAKRQMRADYVRGLQRVTGKANQLGFFDVVFGDYRAMFALEQQWNAVTAADVQRVVRTYLVPGRRTVVELDPRGEASQ